MENMVEQIGRIVDPGAFWDAPVINEYQEMRQARALDKARQIAALVGFSPAAAAAKATS
jgi:hypothetical protein